MPKHYNLVALGGTFDHFHAGHQQFIEFAASLGRLLYIGVTHPNLTRHKPYSYLIDSPETRVRNVKKCCKQIGINCKLMELNDLYGPTLDDPTIEALVVTEETLSGAKKINETRLKLRLRELPVHVAPLLKNELGQPLHSDQIRAGQANRSGTVYSLLFDRDLILTSNQRQFFKEPLGKLVEEPTLETQSHICVVGDTSLETFLENDWSFDLGVFDRKTQRLKSNSKIIGRLSSTTIAVNPAGQISLDLVKKIQDIMKSENFPRTYIEVSGEEDLATVALVLLLPLESAIYYGQPDRGLVEVHVTEALKGKVFQILK